MKRWTAHAVAPLLVVSLTACAVDSSPVATGEAVVQGAASQTTIPFRMQPEVPRGGLSGSFGVDHIAVDTAGTYVCVLRRGDDLASLRAGFNERGE